MGFSFSNIIASFEGQIYKILAMKLYIFIVVLLDNILIYNKDLKQPYIKVI